MAGVTEDLNQAVLLEEAMSTSQATPNPNIAIFDEAVVLIESTPRQSKVLSSGETMSFREYNKGKPNVLVMIPGYVCDDALFAMIAVLPEFQDHHIIAVNPIGWNGSSMNTPIISHEKNADEVMELLRMMGIGKAVVGGYSTGGGIAFYMAQKYPFLISAAFLIHSIPLDGLKVFDKNGKPFESAEGAAKMIATAWPDDIDDDTYFQQLVPFSTNSIGFPPRSHRIFKYLADAGRNMPGKVEAVIANVNFNVSPTKTHFAESSDALTNLKSKVVVIHSSADVILPGDHVEQVTKRAIAEKWAPPGMISFYDDREGHLMFFDNPTAFASIYRQAFKEQVIS